MRFLLALLTLSAGPAYAQTVVDPTQIALVCAYNSAVPAPISGQYAFVQCDSTGKLLVAGAGGTPGGTANQIQYNNAGVFGGFTMSGDATLVPATGVITVASIGGKAVGTSGATIPLLNGANTWATNQVFSAASSIAASFAVTSTFNTVLWNGAQLGWGPAAAVDINTTPDTYFTRVAAGIIQSNGALYSNSATVFHGSKTTITGGSTANTPTLTSGPVTGNPTKWIPIDDNGTIRYIPSW